MVAQTAAIAVANANAQHTCVEGMCLAYVRTWLEITNRENTALDAWNAALHKHPGDRKPPKGAPVFWGLNDGHIAESMGDGWIRSTDRLVVGQVTTVPLSDIEQHWGKPYLGWTQDLNGVEIPWLSADPFAGGLVYVSRLHRGQHDSDSVSRLRWRLDHHDRIPAHVRPGQGNDYGPRVTLAVEYLQTQVAPDIKGPHDGSSLSNPQANALFGTTYTVIEA